MIELNLLSIPQIFLIGIMIYLGINHFFIYFRRKEHREDLTFAITCFVMSGYNITSVGTHNVTNVVYGAILQRLSIFIIALFMFSFLWFVIDYSKHKPGKFTYLLSVYTIIVAAVIYFERSGLFLSNTVSNVKFISLSNNINVKYYEMAVGPQFYFQTVAIVVVFLYTIKICIDLFRKKEKERAIPLLISIVLIFTAILNDSAVNMSLYKFIYVIEYAYSGLVFVMAYSLSNEIVMAAKTEKALSESNLTFKHVVKYSPYPIVILDPQEKFEYINPMFVDTFGYTLEDIPDLKSWFDKAYPDDESKEYAEKTWALVPKNINNNKIGSREFKITCKNGVVRDVSFNLATMKNGNMFVIFRDITDQNDINNSLQESEGRWKSLIENSIDGIIIIRNFDILFVNQKVLDMFKFKSKEDAYNQNFLNYISPEYHERVIKNNEKILSSSEELKKYEVKALKSDGVEIDLEIVAGSIIYKGEPARQVIVRDITDFKRAEKIIMNQFEENQAQYEELEVINEELASTHNDLIELNLTLASQKERLSTTLKSIGDAVITVDSRGVVDLINEKARQLLGKTESESMGKSVSQIFHLIDENTEKEYFNPVFETLKKGNIIEFENDIYLVAEDGAKRYISATSAPIKDQIDGEVVGAILVFRDITEKILLEDELLKTTKVESLGIFAGGIAHDFNNLLTAILGNISLARLEMKDDENCYKILKDAEDVSLQARELTQQLLTFSKGGSPIKTTISLQELLEDTSAFALRGSHVKCRFTFEENLWNANVDRGQISQVIHNLVLNSRQAMPGGGNVFISAENVKVSLKDKLGLKDGKYVKIIIKDEGSGISVDYIKRIFDPYFTTKEKGHGLGLSVSYSIVKKHDGRIVVESSDDGTSFIIYLPASKEKVLEAEPSLIIPDSYEGKILLMDDEEMILTIGSKMLSRMGFDVITSKDGADAIDKYKIALKSDEPVNLVIMDLTIPGGMGGKDTIVELLVIDPDLKAIVSSGYSNDPVMADHKKYGFCGIVAKPYRFNELKETIHLAMEEMDVMKLRN